MSTLALSQYITLDGVVQAPGHAEEDRRGGFEHGGWSQPWMAEHAELIKADDEQLGALLFGRRTYEMFASYWPTVPAGDPVADTLNGAPKYLASTTLTEGPWAPTTVISEDVPGAVARLKQDLPDESVVRVIGSNGLAQTLIAEGLVDRYELIIHPVVLGSGARLFGDGALRQQLVLVDSTSTKSGLVKLTYTPA